MSGVDECIHGLGPVEACVICNGRAKREAAEAAAWPRDELPVRSFTADTSVGGVDFTICACGVVLVRAFMAYRHINACPIAIEAEAGGTNYPHTVGWRL